MLVNRFVSFLALMLPLASAALSEVQFQVSFSDSAVKVPISGRAVVYLSKNSNSPKNGPNWFSPEPMLSVRIKNVRPGQIVTLKPSNSVTFPKKFTATNGSWKVQVVFDRDLGGREIGNSPGNVYSQTQTVDIDWSSSQVFKITCDQLIAARPFKETDSTKLAEIESKLLTKFYGRPTKMRAAVVLPEGWEAETTANYPIIYSIPGFGGTHEGLSGRTTRSGTVRDGEKFIYVVLDPSCPTGHSVFADSVNNGPWGKALTTELIPYIESKFRAVAIPGGRFVTGHSSGGWSSFWLQVAYPDFFGGCWSTAPDPIDFRDFQRINLYRAKENAFIDPQGARRPLARQGDRVLVEYEPFSDMERPIRGEQLGSFHAVFGPKGKDGDPEPVWNLVTGDINSKVAEHWKKYDIGLILRQNVKSLTPKLKGKIHCYMGNEDTFYLEGAVKLLIEDLKKMGNPYDAKVEIFPGDHGSVMTAALRARIDQEMAAQWRSAQRK